MKNTQKEEISVKGVALSGASAFYIALVYIVSSWVLSISWLVATRFVPALKAWDWLLLVPMLLVWLILLVHILACFYKIVITPDCAVLLWFGIPVRRVAASDFRVFCAAGNDREDVLCLCSCAVEEMARRQEAWMRKRFLHRDDVPVCKRRGDWQAVFAKRYLNRLRSRPLTIFRKPEIVMFQMRPEVQYAVRQMYPQLPYRNYTEVTSPWLSPFSGISENQAVCYPTALRRYTLDLQAEGIRIKNKKEEVSFLSAEKIRSIVRVDIFRAYHRCEPHHTPLLMVTDLTEEQLADRARYRGENGADQALLAMMEATYLAMHWNVMMKGCCAVHYTKENDRKLRTLYPHAHRNEIAGNWMQDSGK